MANNAGKHVGEKVKLKKHDDSEHEGVVVSTDGSNITLHVTGGSHKVYQVSDVKQADYDDFRGIHQPDYFPPTDNDGEKKVKGH